MSTKAEKFQQAVAELSNQIQAKASKAGLPCLPPEALQLAISGMMSRRSGRPLAKSPTFRERPLASLLHRAISWHQGSGYLGSIFSAREDCRLLVRFDPEHFGSYWTADKSRMARDRAALDGFQLLSHDLAEDLHSVIDTVALIMLGNRSQAVAAWSRALGR